MKNMRSIIAKIAMQIFLSSSLISVFFWTVTAADLSDRTFTFGVWLQAPERDYNGKTLAQTYKDLGINTFIGLWNWPSEYQMYSGYALASMQAIKDAGMKVYAGNDQAAVDWINSHPEFNDNFVGYLLGDEPDMNRNSGIIADAAANTPLAWKARGEALRALDSVRPIYANFGKPFAKDAWYGNENGNLGSQAADFAAYVSPTNVISSDYYGITDPYELPINHGIWTYGRAVRNTVRWSDGRPVWGVVEASAPWTQASSSNWMYQRMPANLIMPIVWNMVIHGAQGIIYFCHDFSPANVNKGVFATLLEPGMPEAMKAANESVMAYSAVLKSPNLACNSVLTNGSVNIIALAKNFNGDIFIFAMGDGNSNYPNGQAVDADIQINSTRTGDIYVLNDLRTLSMVNGKLSDHFKPYEIHIYSTNGTIGLQKNLDLCKVYPNPYKPGTGNNHDRSNGIVFDGLTAKADMKIFSLSGELVFAHKKDNPEVAYIWPAENNGGKKVASGVYIYMIANPETKQSVKGKIVIVR